MKTSYAEKLKHPNWQKKRLKVLERAGFECEQCGDSDSTLHVHHNDYFKGREPWEYEDAQLIALCKDCHDSTHSEADILRLEASFIGPCSPFARDSVASIVAGVNMRPMADIPDPHLYMLGRLISFFPKGGRNGHLGAHEIEALIDAIGSDTRGFNELLRSFAKLGEKEDA